MIRQSFASQVSRLAPVAVVVSAADAEVGESRPQRRGEAALVNLMIQGKTPEEAASDPFISAHTARTHLKRIFLKTSTHRQPELVVRLLSAVL